MIIFTKTKLINLDNVFSAWVDGSHVSFVMGGNQTTLYLPSADYAVRIYKELISEVAKGTLIFNVDRRIEQYDKERDDYMKAKKEEIGNDPA